MEIANSSGWSVWVPRSEPSCVDQTESQGEGQHNKYDGVENSFLESLNFIHLEKFNIRLLDCWSHWFQASHV